MNLLELIKEKLTGSEIEEISVFLGERPENISVALDKVLPTVFGVVILTTTDQNAGKVMDVLKDGGHTGEILDDLGDLFASPEKIQLLISVGTNIFNHFYGGKSQIVSDTIASLSDIRKTSASSLLGLVSPIVLGALGKVVESEGLGISGLKKLLQEQKESVLIAIPPILVNKLVSKEETGSKKPSKSKEKVKTESRETKSGSPMVWIFLLLLVLALGAGVVYMFKFREKGAPALPAEQLPLKDTTVFEKPDSTLSQPVKDSVLVPPNQLLQKSDSLQQAPKPGPSTGASISSEESATVLGEELNTSNNWIMLPKLSFDRGSAEVRYAGGLSDIVRYLRNTPSATITIAGGGQSADDNMGEYRAYALRELLIERGIPQRRIIIQAKIENSVDSKVTIKISR
ncbi:DUF937 domain-containing protein [Emticicia sp. TH156]|uniref:DUF937 domain-containing protein n=1 Tax=Emticicia sp. TH156 TaxID=2067454 RepID=UPI000C76D1ED|nr:DUF937 domain-containing protein [Emticicia sp. TH156]PLK42658.1 hypothetical protein C0V77_19165 [Emticicia sp. TH156]